MKLEDLDLGPDSPIIESEEGNLFEFIGLKEVLNHFCEKNKFPPAKNLMDYTGPSLIATINNYPVVVYMETSSGFPLLKDDFPGNSTSKSANATYSLQGIFNGDEVYLETDISYTQRYRKVPVMGGNRVEEDGKPRISRTRNDRFKDKYWFLDD